MGCPDYQSDVAATASTLPTSDHLWTWDSTAGTLALGTTPASLARLIR